MRLATRGSPLALLQADRVAALLDEPAEFVVVETAGDLSPDTPIASMAGTGVFVAEVQRAVLDGRADAAVHSAKDLPASGPEELLIAAVPERADPRDAMIGYAFEDLPAGALIGTGAPRRRAQLANRRADLLFGELRGNIETRLAKLPHFDAIVVAVAALERLDLTDAMTGYAPITPQVGQGAIAVECRTSDERTRNALGAIDDPLHHDAVLAERAYLRMLSEFVGGGGSRACDLACGALADPDGITVMLASLDGHVVLRTRVERTDHEPPETIGTEAASVLFHQRGGNLLLGQMTA